jgi:XTP/dITP diphosphohydrolase
MKFLIGTKNKNKIAELSDMLRYHSIAFTLPDELRVALPDVEETGSSFEENASIKALAFANFAKQILGAELAAIADDSGLEVEALNGAPGISSSRYADTNEKRIARVLKELKEANSKLAEENRKARFVCVIALASPCGTVEKFRGEVSGVIISAPRGNRGFGYDPVFVPDGFDKTFAELPPQTKNKISHRAMALRHLEKYLAEQHASSSAKK